MPAGTSSSLVSCLSIAMTEVARPEWVYVSPIRSSRPCTDPSSPGVPWSALNTMSGVCFGKFGGNVMRPMSIRVTRWPRLSHASATPAPDVSDTSRSADQPPIRTATWSFRHARPPRRRGRWQRSLTEGEIGDTRSTEAARCPPPPSRCACHLPLAGDDLTFTLTSTPPPAGFPIPASRPECASHPRADFLTQRLDLRARRIAEIQQKIAMLLTDLRVTDAQAAAPGGIDQCPGLVARRGS